MGTKTETRELPELSPNTVISAPSLVADVHGKLWWIDPRCDQIEAVSAEVESFDDDEDEEIDETIEKIEDEQAEAAH